MNTSPTATRPLITPTPSKNKESAPPANTEGKQAKFVPNTRLLADPFDFPSSLITKLDPDLLAQIHDTIVNGDPQSYRSLYTQFALREKNVSFTAFYHYARRIRVSAALTECARALLPEGVDVNEMLPDLIAARALEAVMDESASPRRIHRLVDAFRIVSTTNFARKRLAIQLGDMQHETHKKDMNEFIDLFRKYIRATGEQDAAILATQQHVASGGQGGK